MQKNCSKNAFLLSGTDKITRFFQKNEHLVEQFLSVFVYTLSLAKLLSCVMARTPHHSSFESEEQLVSLLAGLKVECVEEADFEGRFLAEFHERVAREAVCCSARRHLLSHVMQMLDNFGRGRLAVGASTLGLGAVAVAFVFYPVEKAAVDTAASVTVDRNVPFMQMPALSGDLPEYTTVRVIQEPASFDNNGIMITRGQHATIIQIPSLYAPQQQRQADSATGNIYRPVPAGSLPASSVRYAF